MKTVAIVGKAQITRGFAPYADPSVDIWAYNDFAFRHAPRVTGVFEMHTDALETARYSQEYKDWLRQPHDFPIWMHQADERIPASVEYPRGEIGEKYLRHTWRGESRVRDFYTSSTPYALALALHLGYQRIELYGIELSATPTYFEERDCVFFWMGQAEARGVDLVIHPASKLFDTALYPFEIVL